MAAYTKPHQITKEESERLRGERDQINFINLRFERWKTAGLTLLLYTAYTLYAISNLVRGKISSAKFNTILNQP